MPFQKGHDPNRAKGRPKGSLNERTKAEAACARAGIDPFDLLVQGAIGGDMNAIIQLCKHIEPPRKPVDMAIDPEKARIEVIIKRWGE